MDTGLLISINLPGQIGPPVAHTTKQVFSCKMPITETDKSGILTRKIKHTNRGTQICTRELRISPAVVSHWKNGDCPIWADPRMWKKLNKEERVLAYVKTFDEGLGVKYE